MLESIVWATRGRSWGFRFLLDGGLSDPLPAYERAFAAAGDTPTAWVRGSDHVAFRIPDPEGRRDTAGRVIPHEFIVFGELGDSIDSAEAGIREIWPLVSSTYARSWDAPRPPHTTGHDAGEAP